MADFLNGVFISEILADNAGGSAVDVDGDGNRNKADEFIEFGNATGAPISLDGYQVWSQKNGLLYSFGSGDILNVGEAATVVGNYTGTPPPGFYSAGIAENANFIPDGEGQKFDTIFLVDTATGDYIIFSYGTPPRAPTLPTGFTGTNQVGSGESINSNAPNGAAFARDSNGTFVETTPTPNTPNVACFAQDTMILTRHGERRIDTLRPGDRIPTYDDGMQPLLGVCSVHVSASDLLRTPTLRPLVFDGKLLQSKNKIRLSPAHALLFTSVFAEMLFASPQVLVRARHLEASGHARAEIPREGVTYYNLLFAEHTLVMANGFWSESYQHSRDSDALGGALQSHWDLAPGVTLENQLKTHSARPILRKYESLVLIDSMSRIVAAKSDRETTKAVATPRMARMQTGS